MGSFDYWSVATLQISIPVLMLISAVLQVPSVYRGGMWGKHWLRMI